jgi:hypothetical protein
MNLINVISNTSTAEGIKPFAYGSGKSLLISKLRAGMHGATATLTTQDMARLCAWIDLGIPHGGKYNDDMRHDDSVKYEQRLKRRLDHEALEKANIAAFTSDSQYKFYMAIGENPNRIASKGSNYPLKVKYSALAHRLSILVPSEGVLTLVDLRGRRIMTVNVSKQDFLSRPEKSFYLRAPAGLYIVKFKGRKGRAESTIPIL